MASKRTILLTQLDPTDWEGEKRERIERGRILERSSTFSLDFPTIGPSNPNKARGKVDPHCKGYVRVLGLWSFDKL